MDARHVVENPAQALDGDPIQVDVVSSAQDAEQPSPIFALPPEVRYFYFYPNLPIDSLCLFSRTCRIAENETIPFRFLFALLHRAVHALPSPRTNVAQPVDETRLAALDILERHPELLFVSENEMVTDHHGRRIKGSPYRILLGAGDVWALKQVREFIIPLIENGEALAEAEFKAQFPNCPWPPQQDMPEAYLYDDRNKAQIAAVKAQLQVIVAKISADPCANGEATLDETRQAVAGLCQIFAPKEREVIQTGLHFPLGIMQEILKAYNIQFVPWNGNKLAYFSRAVIGLAEAASTAVDGQCYKQGLVYLDFAKGPDRTDGLFCRHPKGIPSEEAPLAGKLGGKVFVDPYDGYSCVRNTSNPAAVVFDGFNKNGRRGGGGSCAGPAAGGGAFAKLMENKSRSYWEQLCCNTQRSQHTFPLSMSARGNA